MTPDGIKALVCLVGAAIMSGIGMCILMSMAEDIIKSLLTMTPNQNVAHAKQIGQQQEEKENQK